MQTITLGRHAKLVQAAVDQLQAQRFTARCWEKDASLWTKDAAEQQAIRQRLGWLTTPGVMAGRLAELERFADEIKAAGFTHAAVLGMGGSSLFPEVCRLTFGVARGGVDLAILDSTDPTAILECQRRSPPASTLAIISSKSGSTAETSALASYYYEAFKAADGNPGAHCVAVTDAGSPLDALAKKRRFRRVFTLGPETGQDVGGRFSALTYFGLVPASLSGIEMRRLVQKGQEMLARCGPKAPAADNPAVQLGAALGALAAAGKDKLTFLLAPPLESFGTWAEQLIAESTGKQGKGIAPIHGEPRLSPDAYADDRVFVELQLAGEPERPLERLADALADAGHPVIRIRWQDRYDLGGEAMKWSLATSVAGYLLGVNPFSEPNVAESKQVTKELLAAYTEDQHLPDPAPLLEDGGVAVYGALEPSPRSLADALSAFFAQGQPRDHVTLLAFLPRTAASDAALRALRGAIARAGRRATALQFGPRYLHSTGQLYKGGQDGGLFVLLTADENRDLPIPGEPHTFGILKQAQALGDFEAMRQKGRRILRVHLRGKPDQLLQRVTDAAAASAARG